MWRLKCRSRSDNRSGLTHCHSPQFVWRVCPPTLRRWGLQQGEAPPNLSCSALCLGAPGQWEGGAEVALLQGCFIPASRSCCSTSRAGSEGPVTPLTPSDSSGRTDKGIRSGLKPQGATGLRLLRDKGLGHPTSYPLRQAEPQAKEEKNPECLGEEGEGVCQLGPEEQLRWQRCARNPEEEASWISRAPGASGQREGRAGRAAQVLVQDRSTCSGFWSCSRLSAPAGRDLIRRHTPSPHPGYPV